VSVLLRQPGGFEGLRRVHVGTTVHDLGVAKRHDVGDRHLDVHPMLRPTPMASKQDNPISGINVLLGDHAECAVLPKVHVLAPLAAEAIVAAKRLGIRKKLGWKLVDAVRVQYLEHRADIFDVHSLGRLDCPAQSLHVLLRHRPRSIPQAQESA